MEEITSDLLVKAIMEVDIIMEDRIETKIKKKSPETQRRFFFH